MGTMFGLFKKKRPSLPELPPPPSPPEFPMPAGDIPSIKAPEVPKEIALPEEAPEIPEPQEIPQPEELPAGLPEAPAPEMPELPEPVEEPMPEEPTRIEPKPAEEAPAEEVEIPERETIRKPIGTAFVAVDEYRTIMDHSNRVREKLDEADNFVHRLSEIRAEEEKVFDKWRSQLEEIERKLGQIDRVIAKSRR
ncbi:MAG: hypothetical protein QXM31_01300 [Candidatus Woesearchaeota archaeon]